MTLGDSREAANKLLREAMRLLREFCSAMPVRPVLTESQNWLLKQSIPEESTKQKKVSGKRHQKTLKTL